MLNPILTLLRDRGSAQYGQEAVSQLEHALQCATLAEQAQAPSTLITAALLHDLGHLLHSLGEDAAVQGIDDHHEHRAVPMLRRVFPVAVTEPIRLHVDAKRYLCAVDAAYWQTLSPASKQSLEVQGGIFSPDEAAAFIRQPFAPDATQLRRWDDLAKVPHQPTPTLDHFVPILASCQLVAIAED